MKTILKISNALLLLGIILLACHLGSPSARGRVELGDNPANEFIRGDANDDGVVILSDPIRILSMLFQGGGNLYCEDSADANDDGEINLTDPILILQTLFDGNVGGISAPYPYRGFDPTSDDMHCKDFEG